MQPSVRPGEYKAGFDIPTCFIPLNAYAPLMVTSPVIQRPLFGIMSMLFSIFLFATMDALVKWLSEGYPTYQIMFFRSAVALLPVSVFIARAGGIRILRTARWKLHLFRCAIGVCAMGSAFTGISLLPLADAMAIFHSAPILMTVLSVPLLGERVGIRRWMAVLMGFIGVLLVVKPGSAVFSNGAVIMMFAAFLVALASNLIRILSQTEDPACITFYFTLVASLVTGVISLIYGWIAPDMGDLLCLIAVGILGGCAQYCMTVSFKYAEVGLLSPLKYLMIVIGGVFGYLFWGEIPDGFSIAGIMVIIGSGIYTMHREALLGRRVSNLRKAALQGR